MRKIFIGALAAGLYLSACQGDQDKVNENETATSRYGKNARNKEHGGNDAAPIVVDSQKLLKENPNLGKTLAQNLSMYSMLTDFRTAVLNSEQSERLEGGQFTIFAPTNTAFEDLPADEKNLLSKGANKGAVRNRVTYHVAEGKLNVAQMQDGMEITTLQGEKIKVIRRGKLVQFQDATGQIINILLPDEHASNGIIHIIDKVMKPAGKGRP